MAHVERAAGGAKAIGAIGRAVVRQDAPDADAVLAKPSKRRAHEAADRRRTFVGQKFDIGDARVIVHRDVQMFPAHPAQAVHARRAAGNSMAEPLDAAQLLDVDVEKIADAGMLVPRAHRWRFEPAAPGQAGASENPCDGGGAHAERTANLRASPLLAAEDLRGELQRSGRGAGTVMRPARAIAQARRPFVAMPPPPFAHGSNGDVEHAGSRLERHTRLDPGHEFLSTAQR